MDTQGFIQIYCGDGKGKTTAAFGQALRAAGHGYRVRVIQFMKDGSSGECLLLKDIPNIIVSSYGLGSLIDPNCPSKQDRDLARQGFSMAKAALAEPWDMLVLDEVIVAVAFGLLSEEELLEICLAKPAGMELVMTGQPLSPNLAARADLITEAKAVKHPFGAGVPCRKGIEF